MYISVTFFWFFYMVLYFFVGHANFFFKYNIEPIQPTVHIQLLSARERDEVLNRPFTGIQNIHEIFKLNFVKKVVCKLLRIRIDFLIFFDIVLSLFVT